MLTIVKANPHDVAVAEVTSVIMIGAQKIAM